LEATSVRKTHVIDFPITTVDITTANSPMILVLDGVSDAVSDGVPDAVPDGVPDELLDGKMPCDFSL
jgi:hypothetical protein